MIEPTELKLHSSGTAPRPQPPPCGDLGCALSSGDPEGTLASLCDLAAPVLGRPIVDQTGLGGTWDIVLSVPLPTPGTEDLSTAMRESFEQRLGLRLQPQRVTADFVQVDAVHHPSPN